MVCISVHRLGCLGLKYNSLPIIYLQVLYATLSLKWRGCFYLNTQLVLTMILCLQKPFNMSKTFMEWEKFLCPRNALYSITRSDTTQILKEKTNSLFYATLPGYIRVSETPSFLPGIGKWVKGHRK